MGASSLIPRTGRSPELAAGIALRFGAIVVTLAVQALLLFGGAGTLQWPWAWVYFGISLATVLIGSTIVLRTSPELIAERGRPRQMRSWDKAVSGVLLVAGYLALPLVAGLDMRFGWTPVVSAVWHVTGAAVLAAGFSLTVWAMRANAYFSTAVRIQDERGHTVCSRGPYRFVRHPGYVGYIFQSLGIPFLLGSCWALLPAFATIIALVIRTALEDRTLQAELPGYREYAQEVRYRLVPGIW
jgi:protein-S-isoprenylcysteine O-methyltransferase Ste14